MFYAMLDVYFYYRVSENGFVYVNTRYLWKFKEKYIKSIQLNKSKTSGQKQFLTHNLK